MDVELVALTQPVSLEDKNPISICEQAASVCYNSKPTKAYRIAKACMASGHRSIMEHISFTFHVKGISRACLAQLSRHRHISLSVRSQRYCREDDFDYVNPFNRADPKMYELYGCVANANEVYQSLMADGAKAEDARMVLPNACCTELYITANARSLIEMSYLRLCSRAQKEIRELFQAMKEIIKDFCPEVAERMVPGCEQHKEIFFCSEREGCGRHPRLGELLERK